MPGLEPPQKENRSHKPHAKQHTTMNGTTTDPRDIFVLFDNEEDVFEEDADERAIPSPASATNDAARDDSPDALVKRENSAIRCVKLFAILVLLLAAGTVAGLVFAFTKGSEKSRFENDFVLISKAITQSLMQDAEAFFSSARSIATTITILMEAYNATQIDFSVPLHRYKQLTNEIVKSSYFATWSPLLRSDEERRQFEAMVAAKEKEGFFDQLFYPVCFVCGEENMVPSKPDAIVVFPGSGQYQCDDLDGAGRNGVIDSSACNYVTSMVLEECSCKLASKEKEPRQTRSPAKGIYRLGQNLTIEDEQWNGGPYMPMFLDSLLIADRQPMLYNHLSHPMLAQAASQMIFTATPQLTKMLENKEPSFYSSVDYFDSGPHSILYFPVRSPDGPEIAGALSLRLNWASLLRNPVPRNGQLALVVIESSCGQVHTYKIKEGGIHLEWVGEGDFHDQRYDDMVGQTSFHDFSYFRLASVGRDINTTQAGSCDYRFTVYPTVALEGRYMTSNPWIYSMSSVQIVLFTTIVFYLYDSMVRSRQTKIMAAAKKTDTIVASLFPESVRNRLYERAHIEPRGAVDSFMTRSINSFMPDPTISQASIFGTAPIADFFPSCTVAFIDIANFTAWCSEREPSQVFILLENIYHEFDKIADQLGVFKVETIGDSYVAVTGLPTPMKDHAVVMTRFAFMCLAKMEHRVKELEVSLGPSTGDLRARCGLHSGPVTAGVLRGTKARFQLFGDTVNTASRMESSSAANKIHASRQTVSCLAEANKGSWALPREDKVHLKGKGTLQTFWLDPGREKALRRSSSLLTTPLSVATSPLEMVSGDADGLQRKQRLIKWNVEVLHDLLNRLVTSRSNCANTQTIPLEESSGPTKVSVGTSVIDEMTEIISLPRFDPEIHQNLHPVKLPRVVKQQLHEYVSNIARLYRDDVPFHNFEHASHVIMSATKLMKRIMSPEGIDWDLEGIIDDDERHIEIARQVHNVTYGMSSDPLMQFSVVFSALIHDVDHTGLTNKELIDVKAPLAEVYRAKCIAAQNSVNVAWNLLMNDAYQDLRACIFRNYHEESRFRELIVDAVLATDIADNELGTLRRSRWDQAFAAETSTRPFETDMDCKATIVFEHIIQASDVCHCMQHWHTYQKFNSRLFEERYVAFRKGAAGEKPPWVGWYESEIWFFDNYIIPLAQKLDDCGVFGVSYHEYLNYAQENRLEWERKGHEIVESLRADVELKYEGVVSNSDISRGLPTPG
jgi:class 3 adenylate cyclase